MKIEAARDRLLSLAGKAAYLRGQEYAENSYVQWLVWDEPTLVAKVKGSGRAMHDTAVQLVAEGDCWMPLVPECSCPYDDGPWCKHAVAVMLVAERNSADILAQVPLQERIAGMSLQDFKRILPKLMEIDGVRRVLLEALGSTQRPEALVDSDKVEHETRRKVQQIVRQAIGQWEEYAPISSIFAPLERIVDDARDLVDEGQVEKATAILTAVTDEFLQVWEEFDDENAESGGFLDLVADTWLALFIEGGVDRSKQAELLNQVWEWDQTARGYDVTALTPLIVWLQYGYELEGLRSENEVLWQEGGETVAVAWSDHLSHSGEDAACLDYSERLGLDVFHALYLIRTNRIPEAIAYAEKHIVSDQDGLPVVLALKEVGEAAGALDFGIKVLQRSPMTNNLAEKLADIAEELGEHDLLLPLHQRAWKKDPSFARYQRIKELSGEGWAQLAPTILEGLGARYGHDDGIRILLAEGQIDAVIGSLQQGVWMSDETLGQVATALVRSRPDWVIDYFSQRAEEVMNAARSQDYVNAAKCLGWVRDAYRTLNREDDWNARKAEWLKDHRRKRSLLPLIERL